MKINQAIVIILSLSVFPFLQGCAPTMVAGGATAVGVSAMEERGISGVFNDANIRADIYALWFEYDPILNEMLELSVHEGRILLTGTVATPQQQIDAVRLIWQVKDVREVNDESVVGAGSGFTGYASDTWITTRLKAELMFEQDIQSINYNIKTVNGIVYLLGIAQNQEELERIIEIARDIDAVKEIVNYVHIKGDTQTAAGDDPSGPAQAG